MQNYAVIDISGTQATSPVTMVALNDDNHAAFGFNTGDAVPDVSPYDKYQVYTWSNGAAIALEPINWIQGGYNAANRLYAWNVSRPEWLTASGAVYANSLAGEIYDVGGEMWFNAGMSGCPNLPDPPYGKTENSRGSKIYFDNIGCVSEKGYVGGGGRAELPDGPQPRFCSYAFIKDPTDHFTVFRDGRSYASSYNDPRPVEGQVTVDENTFFH